MTPASTDLSAMISSFRDEVASFAIMMREGTSAPDAIRGSYGPVLEALQNPPPARSLDDVAAALVYLLEFGNLGQADEAMLRAAITGLAPLLDMPEDPADFSCDFDFAESPSYLESHPQA